MIQPHPATLERQTPNPADPADPADGTASSLVEPRRQRMAPDERRQQIFIHAQRLFNARPYEEVSATDIAAEAGVARGLINHYFGNKRELYLEVIRTSATVSEVEMAKLPEGTLEERIDVAMVWFLDSLEQSGSTWLTLGSSGVSRDPDLERILVSSENKSIELMVEACGLSGQAEHGEQIRAMFRAYAQLARSGAREWLLRRTLTRPQLSILLVSTLRAIVRDAVLAGL